MTAAFIVTLVLDTDPSVETLTGMSDEIEHACEQAGLEVEDVKPWQRPTVSEAPVMPTQPFNPPIL